MGVETFMLPVQHTAGCQSLPDKSQFWMAEFATGIEKTEAFYLHNNMVKHSAHMILTFDPKTTSHVFMHMYV